MKARNAEVDICNDFEKRKQDKANDSESLRNILPKNIERELRISFPLPGVDCFVL